MSIDWYSKILNGEMSSGDAANLVEKLEHKYKIIEMVEKLEQESKIIEEESERKTQRITSLEEELLKTQEDYVRTRDANDNKLLIINRLEEQIGNLEKEIRHIHRLLDNSKAKTKDVETKMEKILREREELQIRMFEPDQSKEVK